MRHFISSLILLMLTFSSFSCNSVDNDLDEKSVIAIYLHDSPGQVEALNVHIQSISLVHDETGEEIILDEPDRVVNVLEFVNGNIFLIGEKEVEAGAYSDIRIQLGEENSVFVDGSEYDLGLEGNGEVNLNYNISVEHGEEARIFLDLDAQNSIVSNGDYMLEPAIRVYGDSDGKVVSGTVLPEDQLTGINVKRSLGAGQAYTSTHTEDNTGEFQLMGIEPGVYDIELKPHTPELMPVVHSYFRLENEQDDEVVTLGTYKLGESELLNTDGSWLRRELAPGAELLQKHFDNFDGVPRFIHLIAVDVEHPGIEVGIYIPHFWGNDPHRTAISDFGEDARALAATNAGFAPGGSDYFNYGIIKIEGEVFPYVQMGTDEYWDELLMDGRRFFGSSAVGIDYDGNWHFRQRDGDTWDDDWPEARHAIAGGHRVLKDGEIMDNIVEGTYQHDRERRHMETQHPRTALCKTGDRVAVLFAIDGRHDESVGMSLMEMAEFMLDLGCVNAINFDGGGSTTMWTEEHGVVNHPTDNSQFNHKGQRNLRNALIINKR